jgi:hypothetical protein
MGAQAPDGSQVTNYERDDRSEEMTQNTAQRDRE